MLTIIQKIQSITKMWQWSEPFHTLNIIAVIKIKFDNINEEYRPLKRKLGRFLYFLSNFLFLVASGN